MVTEKILEQFGSDVIQWLIESQHVAMLLTDAQRRMLSCNTYSAKLMGYEEGELIGKEVSMLHASSQLDSELMSMLVHQKETGITSLDFPFRHKDGHIIWLNISGGFIDDQGHKLWTAVDITARKNAEAELQLLKERLEYAIEGNKDVVWDWDIVHDRLDISDQWHQIVGYTRQDVPYEIRQWRKRIHPDDRRRVIETIRRVMDEQTKFLDVEYRFIHKNGRILWILTRAVTLYDDEGRAVRMVGTHRDITRIKELELRLQEQARTIEDQRDELWYQAHHDTLTALPNRIYFQQLLTQAIAHAREEESSLTLLFVDVDHFKQINDRYGHEMGDNVLRYVADLLRRGVRQDDTVARLGGDEFVLIIPGIPDTAKVSRLVEKLLRLFESPYEWAGGSMQLSVSIGIARYPDDSDDADTLLRHADQAMYHAKTSGRGRYRIYTALE